MRAGDFLTGGSTVLLWVLLGLAVAGVGNAFKIVSSEIMWGLLGLSAVFLVLLLRYRSFKAKIGITGLELSATQNGKTTEQDQGISSGFQSDAVAREGDES